MNHGREALIGLVGAHGDAFEFVEVAEEAPDEMPRFVHLLINGERLCAARMLAGNALGAARIHSAIMALLSNAWLTTSALPIPRSAATAHRVEVLSRQKHEAHAIGGRSISAGIWWSCRLSSGQSLDFESPFCALTLAVNLEDRSVDQDVFHVGIIGDGVE